MKKKHKKTFAKLAVILCAALLICSIPFAVIAEDGYVDDEAFFCNCGTRPFDLDPQKLKNQEYTREEITLRAEHRLLHSRIKERLFVPYVTGEEQMRTVENTLRTIVGERGTLECEIPYEGLHIFKYSVTASEDVLAEIFIEVLAAGISCDCGVYHVISDPDSDTAVMFPVPSYITIESGDNILLWNPNPPKSISLNQEKVYNKEYTQEELLIYIENELATSMRFMGELYLKCPTEDAEKTTAELSTLIGAEVEFSHLNIDGTIAAYSVKIDESALPQTMLKLLTEGVYATAMGVGYPESDMPFLCGDLNTDNKLNAADYMMLKRVVLETHTISEKRTVLADVNGDDKINAQDYMMVKRHILGTFEITRGAMITDPWDD